MKQLSSSQDAEGCSRQPGEDQISRPALSGHSSSSLSPPANHAWSSEKFRPAQSSVKFRLQRRAPRLPILWRTQTQIISAFQSKAEIVGSDLAPETVWWQSRWPRDVVGLARLGKRQQALASPRLCPPGDPHLVYSICPSLLFSETSRSHLYASIAKPALGPSTACSNTISIIISSI